MRMEIQLLIFSFKTQFKQKYIYKRKRISGVHKLIHSIFTILLLIISDVKMEIHIKKDHFFFFLPKKRHLTEN